MTSTMHFSKIIIVDSIPHGERNTARELYADVLLRAQVFMPAPDVIYQRIESHNEFQTLLLNLTAQAASTGEIPLLHIECHGSNDGLAFADGSFAAWADIKGPLTSLNVATRLNLLVVVAACDGSALTHTLSLTDRAPLHGLIGPIRDVTGIELARSYLAFYEKILETRSAQQAVDAMCNATPNTFIYRAAEWVFQYVWDHYQQTHETPEARLQRGQRMAENPPTDYDGPPIQAERFAQLLAETNPAFFEKFRRTFFLCDLFPEHETRFAVFYQKS